MSEIKSLAAPKASFDRRSVVKTAAWSVPVIAAAIAAPAAAASTPPTYSAAFIAGSGSPAVAGAPQMSGTGHQGFAVSTTGAAMTGAISVVITVQPDAAATAAGVGLAVTAAALPPSGKSSPYNFAYSRTGAGNAASNAVLKYTVTVAVTVVESATKKTVLPPMAFVATLQPITAVSLVPGTGVPVIVGTPKSVGTGPQGFKVTTTGASVMGTITVGIKVTPDAAATAAGIGLTVTASALTRTGQSAPYDFVYSRTGNGALPNSGVLTYTVTVTVSGAGAPSTDMVFNVTLRKG
ncbi:hypothetical protein [Microbacterium sp. Bi128]|uniref:hypothetical protein n=1 Tax=Microbacterium sp. Bi128 TaxID=2821115 RepID=UPI001D505B13|nr:hypothetical protein [Microbacterium sp. Bi128]CAH0319533.1 hypothetical protein SRABI128_04818 [Microbacterium sp. Bi128]